VKAPAKGCPQKIPDFGLKNPMFWSFGPQKFYIGHVLCPKKRIFGPFFTVFLLPSAVCVSELDPTPELFSSGLVIFSGQIGLEYLQKSPILGLKNPICGRLSNFWPKNPILGQGNPKFSP
jgi:hypothetical protein